MNMSPLQAKKNVGRKSLALDLFLFLLHHKISFSFVKANNIYQPSCASFLSLNLDLHGDLALGLPQGEASLPSTAIKY